MSLRFDWPRLDLLPAGRAWRSEGPLLPLPLEPQTARRDAYPPRSTGLPGQPPEPLHRRKRLSQVVNGSFSAPACFLLRSSLNPCCLAAATWSCRGLRLSVSAMRSTHSGNLFGQAGFVPVLWALGTGLCEEAHRGCRPAGRGGAKERKGQCLTSSPRASNRAPS
jgi:hypothetical protein